MTFLLLLTTASAVVCSACAVRLALIGRRMSRSLGALLVARNQTAAALGDLLQRCSPFLDCDRCGGRLDAADGILLADGDDGHLLLACGHCADDVPH